MSIYTECVWHKDGCNNRGLHKFEQGLATVLIVTLQFPRIIYWEHSMFNLFLDAEERPYMSASTPLVWLLLNIFIHWHTLHWCNISIHVHTWRWMSSNTTKCTTASCLSLVKTSNRAVTFTTCSLGKNKQLSYTCSMPLSDLQQQNDLASVVLPTIQQKYSNNALAFWISFK